MKDISEKERKSCRDFILLMLGAPAIKVELSEDQLDYAVSKALKSVMESASLQEVKEIAYQWIKRHKYGE